MKSNERVVLAEQEVRNLLVEFKEQVRRILKGKFVALILFGSYARRDYEFGSDIDVLLVVNERLTKEEEDRISGVATDMSLERDIVIAWFDYLHEAFQRWETPFLMNVRKEGIII